MAIPSRGGQYINVGKWSSFNLRSESGAGGSQALVDLTNEKLFNNDSEADLSSPAGRSRKSNTI